MRIADRILRIGRKFRNERSGKMSVDPEWQAAALTCPHGFGRAQTKAIARGLAWNSTLASRYSTNL